MKTIIHVVNIFTDYALKRPYSLYLWSHFHNEWFIFHILFLVKAFKFLHKYLIISTLNSLIFHISHNIFHIISLFHILKAMNFALKFHIFYTINTYIPHIELWHMMKTKYCFDLSETHLMQILLRHDEIFLFHISP
jgi:hypothetical protein